MEELDLNNILSPTEAEALFAEDPKTEERETEQKEEKNTAEETPREEELFGGPESVGSGKEDSKEKEDTTAEKPGSSPKKTNFYSSIASAFKEDGIFPDLDDDTVDGIKDAESFAEVMEKQIQAKFDERQKRIDDALNAGIEPSAIQNYERTIQYLDSIKTENLEDESDKGEALRRQLIYNDYVNRGYSKERANREVKKSFDGGTDIEDAKEALKSNVDFYKEGYNKLIKEAQEENRKYEEQRKKDAETLKKNILDNDKVFGELQIDKATRQKAFEAISKPVYKDPETGELYTAVQKYEMDNHLDFLKNVGLLYTLTDGFKNLDNLVKGKVRKEMKKGIRELENTINNTQRSSDGNLRFMTGIEEDPDSYAGKGWKLDI